MAYTVKAAKLAERLEVLRAHERAGLFPRKSPRFGTIPEGCVPLSVRFCAVLWSTSPQPAALTLKLLTEAGSLTLVQEGKRGGRGRPAIYTITPAPFN